MKPAAFDYHAPTTTAEALSLLGELGDSAKVIAGGQSLVPMMALRLAAFDHLVDVWGIAELRGIDTDDHTVRLGASTPDALIERDAGVRAAAPLISKVTPFIGHLQIRNRGTIGGSLAHADPAAEYPAAAVALDAELELASPRGTRTLPAGDFFQGVWTTALEPDELLTAVTVPVWSGRCGFAVEEFARRHGDFALAGALAGVQLGDGDRVERCTITVFGTGPTPTRAAGVEAALAGSVAGDHDADELGHQALAELDEPFGDVQAPAAYRVRVGRAMVARAWRGALEDARND